MSYEYSFEGDDSARTWSNRDYVPPPRRYPGRIIIRIEIPSKAPVRDITDEPVKPQKPPITLELEGGDAADAIAADKRRRKQRQQQGYPPELIEQWRREAERRKGKLN